MNKQSFGKDEEEVITLVLNYLLRNPAGKDTIEGIAGWWILQQKIHFAIESVCSAVDYLVCQGYLIEKQILNKKHYELDRSKIEDVRAFLNRMKGTNGSKF